MNRLIMLVSIFIFSAPLFCNKKTEDIPLNPITDRDVFEILKNVRNLKAESVEPDDIAIIETTMGTKKFKFFPDIAPEHCKTFKMLANSGFYDGTLFHRIIPNFMIQGGDILTRDNNPNNDGTGNPGIRINAEFSTKNHGRGIVSTARKGNDINSASGQFFICVADAFHLDGQYTIFGEVFEGMNAADKIVNSPRDSRNDRPLKAIMIKSAKVIKGN